jgi:hypothetical protein
LASAIPLMANDKKKGKGERAMVEKMEAVPCGANQRGLSGLGALWGSAGITHINTNEKLCPQYLLRSDQMDYEVRPMDLKHATILPVGQEGVFQINKNQMMLSFPDSDNQKARAYQIVGIVPAANATDQASTPGLAPSDSR